MNIFRVLEPADLLALTMYAESRGEPVEGQIGVGCVIRTRANRNGTYHDVILKPKQFSCFLQSDPNYPKLVKMAQLLHDEEKVPLDSMFNQIRFLAKGIVYNLILDNVGKADHYYNPVVCSPEWANAMAVTRVINNHTFLRSR